MEERKDLKIPENASDRNEVISGIGRTEIIVIGSMLLVAIVLVVVVYIATKNLPMGFFMAFFIMAITIIAIMRDPIGENLIDKVRILIRYTKMQKRYQYKYHNVFDEVENESK